MGPSCFSIRTRLLLALPWTMLTVDSMPALRSASCRSLSSRRAKSRRSFTICWMRRSPSRERASSSSRFSSVYGRSIRSAKLVQLGRQCRLVLGDHRVGLLVQPQHFDDRLHVALEHGDVVGRRTPAGC